MAITDYKAALAALYRCGAGGCDPRGAGELFEVRAYARLASESLPRVDRARGRA